MKLKILRGSSFYCLLPTTVSTRRDSRKGFVYKDVGIRIVTSGYNANKFKKIERRRHFEEVVRTLKRFFIV